MSDNGKILGLRTFACIVSDLKAAKEWYTRLFGVEPYFDEPFYVGFNISGYELGLMPGEIQEIKPDNIRTYWGVKNIQAVFEKAVAMGAKVHEGPNNVGGELKVATVFDPWNNLLGFIYNPYFKIEG